MSHLKKELENELKREVENCFNELKLNLENEGFSVNAVYNNFEINLEPKKIIVEINANLRIEKYKEISEQKNFKIIVADNLYDNAIVVQEIV